MLSIASTAEPVSTLINGIRGGKVMWIAIGDTLRSQPLLASPRAKHCGVRGIQRTHDGVCVCQQLGLLDERMEALHHPSAG